MSGALVEACCFLCGSLTLLKAAEECRQGGEGVGWEKNCDETHGKCDSVDRPRGLPLLAQLLAPGLKI